MGGEGTARCVDGYALEICSDIGSVSNVIVVKSHFFRNNLNQLIFLHISSSVLC